MCKVVFDRQLSVIFIFYNITRQSHLVETAVIELVEMLISPLSEKEYGRMMPEENQHEPDPYTMLLNAFTQRNTEALVKCKKHHLSHLHPYTQPPTKPPTPPPTYIYITPKTKPLFLYIFLATRLSLDAIKRRLQTINRFGIEENDNSTMKPALFKVTLISHIFIIDELHYEIIFELYFKIYYTLEIFFFDY